MSVIVTNAKNRIAYAIVRSLGQKGIKVYTSDFVPISMSFASRYSKGHFLYPSPFSNQEAFIDCIFKNINRLKPEVLIPVFEETFLIAKYKDELSKQVKMVIPDYDQILIAHNKNKWMAVAKQLKIPVPKTFEVAELLNHQDLIKGLKFPVLIKPKQGGGGWGFTHVDSQVDLESILKTELLYNKFPPERFLVQERIVGEVHCVAMLFRHGKLKAKITYKQLRDYPVKLGQATLRVSIRNHQAEHYFQSILEELNWHGVCQADFLVDSKTGIPYLIDINPRFWGSLLQGIVSGVDFPYLLYKMALKGDIEPVNGFKTGVMTRWIWGDFRALLSYLKISRNKSNLLREYLTLFRKDTFYDDLCLTDPLPFFTFALDAIVKMLKHKTTKPTSHDSLEGEWV